MESQGALDPGDSLLRGAEKVILQPRLHSLPSTSFIYEPCVLIDQRFSQFKHPASGSKIWPTVRGMSKIHRAWYTGSKTEALFQLRDGSGTLLPFAARGACPVRDEAAQMSLLHRRRASSSSSLFSPESIKNKILRSRSYLEVTTPVGKERKKEREKR